MPNTQGRGGITAPRGFTAAGIHADVKGKGGTKKDIALIYSQVPAAAAAVFTRNKVKAAPILVSQEKVRAGKLQAIIVNSGNANACTGDQGLADATAMCTLAAAGLGISADLVAVASTGVIGVNLPLDRIAAGIQAVTPVLSSAGNADAAQAIMTTDTFPKEHTVTVTLSGGQAVTLGGMAKGSGMIHPNMATMLAFVTTDANIGPAALQQALTAATNQSFNMITVDGDSSTNDVCFLLANGLAGNAELEPDTPDYAAFCTGLNQLMIHLAKAVARDGEGATKLFEVQIHGAPTLADARLMARSVAASSLVKAAMFGNDANWGRILCAMGYSGAELDPGKVDLWLGDVQVMAAGAGLKFDEAAALQVLKQTEVVVRAYLYQGEAAATAWGCDLSYDYVKINADYRT